MACCFSSVASFHQEEFGAVMLRYSGVLRNDNVANEATPPGILSHGWVRGGSCSLTITLKRAGGGTDPLPSKSQNLCPLSATSTKMVWGRPSLKTFIFTNSSLSVSYSFDYSKGICTEHKRPWRWTCHSNTAALSLNKLRPSRLLHRHALCGFFFNIEV